MKSNTRTVLNTTLTNTTSYSSGPLDVGDLYELTIDLKVTQATWTGSGNLRLNIGRIGADGNLYPLASSSILAEGSSFSTDIGAGLSTSGAAAQAQRSFGDQIQADLIADSGNSVISATLSIKGK